MTIFCGVGQSGAPIELAPLPRSANTCRLPPPEERCGNPCPFSSCCPLYPTSVELQYHRIGVVELSEGSSVRLSWEMPVGNQALALGADGVNKIPFKLALGCISETTPTLQEFLCLIMLGQAGLQQQQQQQHFVMSKKKNP